MTEAGGIEYRLSMVDNITPVAESGVKAEGELKGSIEQSTESMNTQSLTLIQNIAVLGALKGGLMGLTRELHILGITTDAQNEKIRQMMAGFNIFVDIARIIHGVIGLVEMLKASEIGLAAVETYRAVLKNPAMAGVAVGGAAVAGGVGGYLLAKNGSSITQNFNFSGGRESASSRGITRTSLEAMEGE